MPVPPDRPSSLQLAVRLLSETFSRFIVHDGWAIASHIALSLLMSLFPFLIVVTALAGFAGSVNLADEVAILLFDAWPLEVAGPIAREARAVLTTARSDALTIGAVFALYFASSSVEALRIGLNRAYEQPEWRPWWILRLESIAFVIAGAGVLVAVSILLVLGPLGWRTVLLWLPGLAPYGPTVDLLRLAVTTILIIVTLTLAHKFLPMGRRRWRRIWPGIVFTLVLWVAGGLGFGAYLDGFAKNYVSTYAGLAAVMIALIFLYTLSAIFLLGAEMNAVLMKDDPPRTPRRQR